MIICKSKAEIAKMARAGRVVAAALDLVRQAIQPGAKTADLDMLVEKFIRRSGGRPAFKGYRGYPASTCISINETVVHGIPGERRLEPGQIVSVDIGVELEGYFADAAATYEVREVMPDAHRLVETTKAALTAGIKAARPGNHLYDISAAIEAVAESAGFAVVRDYVGHGIGKAMHEEPQIPNYRPDGSGPKLAEGMVLALEPMLNMGGYEVEVLPDNWTVVTLDRSLSAHFEHTVAVTGEGPQVLTA